jgi:hypothetical protein
MGSQLNSPESPIEYKDILKALKIETTFASG